MFALNTGINAKDEGLIILEFLMSDLKKKTKKQRFNRPNRTEPFGSIRFKSSQSVGSDQLIRKPTGSIWLLVLVLNQFEPPHVQPYI